MSGQTSYDVYVKRGVDFTGRPGFGERVAHVVERGNAGALKRWLASRGEMVHVERSVVHDTNEPSWWRTTTMSGSDSSK